MRRRRRRRADAGNEANPEGGEKNDERDPALVAWDAEDALEEWTLEDERNEKNAEVADAGSGGGGDDDAPSDSAEPAEVEPADAADDASSEAGALKPPPRERVATRGGASFAVWSDLVEHVANGSRLAGPDDAGETEPADGGSPETSSNVASREASTLTWRSAKKTSPRLCFCLYATRFWTTTRRTWKPLSDARTLARTTRRSSRARSWSRV
jgi:hypothetical protein